MKGIDVYQGDGWPLKSVPAKAYRESDFVIVKATQGVSYSRTDYFYKMADKVLKDGKLLGAYHYAAGKDPVKEADFFIKTVKPYLGKTVLCLDWERIQNAAWGSRTWCSEFINRVYAKTGRDCVLYTGLDGIHQNKTLANRVPLWFAGYPNASYSGWTVPKWRYDISPWKTWAIWQFTSSGERCDRNTAVLSREGWLGLAGQKQEEETKKEGYKGKFPYLPPRGYFKYGDGYLQLRAYETQVKRTQKLVNWITGGEIRVDGDYGKLTMEAVRKAQKILGVKQDGLFGEQTLNSAISYKK